LNASKEANEISVIITAFNSEKFITTTIESVINQQVSVGEIIIVNDGSVDRTSEIVNSLKIRNLRLYEQSNSGVAAALNLGILQSKGSILAFLDHDDIWLPGKLEKQFQIINDGRAEMVFTLIQNFIDENIDEKLREKLEVSLAPCAGIHKSTLMIRKESLLSVGLFNTSKKIEFLDWYAYSKDFGIREHMVKEVLVKRRIHGSNQSLLDKDMRKEFPSIIKAIMDRRRNKH
jgi:glycosyltransferase involved in cell wall biosynthesis